MGKIIMATTALEISLDAVDLDVEDLEDVLVTDPLFVDYLNYFLSLPIFPERIQFNSKVCAFEIADDSGKQLTSKLKSLIRSQRQSPAIYKVVKGHSYIDIPLINIDGDESPEAEEIDTTVTVKVLNKEQGVGWIKKERFAQFLKSDCYIQYRLAKLIGQAKVEDDQGNSVSMVTLPSRPTSSRRTTSSKLREVDIIHTEPEKDDRILERCFVSVGNATASQTDAWVRQARIAQKTYPTMSKYSVSPSMIPLRPTSARPKSAYSLLESSRKSVDSGISGITYSRYSSPPKSAASSLYYIDLDGRDSGIGDMQPITPRPTECVCVVGESMVNGVQAPVKMKVLEPKNDNTQPAAVAEKSLQCEDTDQLASVITGTVLKYSIAEVTGESVEDIARINIVTDVIPEAKYAQLSLDDLSRMSVEGHDAPKEAFVPTEQKIKENDKIVSDDESLMNSDEEYEDGDDIFRRPRNAAPPSALGRMKTIDRFKAFLKGTAGEVLWSLWVDIDRLIYGTTNDEINEALYAIKSKYSSLHQEMQRCTSSSILQVIRDWDSRNWTVPQLQHLQRDLAKRLVLYWTPRYLLSKSRSQVKKEERTVNNRWNVILAGRRHTNHTYPDPKVKRFLPLRPTTCLPRSRRTESRIDVNQFRISKEKPDTGYKRVYTSPALMYAHGHVPDIEIMMERDRRHKPTTDTGGDADTRPGSARPKSQRSTPSARSRPQSQEKQEKEAASQVADRPESEFLGGIRLERMLQALARESLSGLFFRRYTEKCGNQHWQNSIRFWTDLQTYHEMFYSDTFDAYRLHRKAQHIYSQYIVAGAPQTIKCDLETKRQIQKQIDPPFEDLFDRAEEFCLVTLFEAWKLMLKDDAVGFTKVEQVEVSRNFHSKNKELLAVQAKGLIRQTKKEEEDEEDEVGMEDYQDPVYDPSIILNVKEQFREMSVDKLSTNRIELEYFRQFLADHYASMDLLCWMDIEAFRRIPHSDEKARDAKAKMIKTKYLNKKYFLGPNSPAGKESQNKIMEIGGGWGKLLDDRPPTHVLIEAQKFVRERLDKKWLPLFLSAPEFEERQNPVVKMEEVVDDVLVQKRKQSAMVTRMLESRWLSSSKEIISFRKALLNPVTSAHFRRFVSMKGNFLENDVLFWREVQMFKNMYHLHTEDSAIQGKITAIIQCFIDSQIPPSLQIDIRNEQADKIIDKRRELGPYLFRDAQLTVFRILVPFWNDFCEYRKGLTDATLAAKLEKQKRRMKRQKRISPPSEKDSSKKSSARTGSSDGSVKSGGDEVDGEEVAHEEVEVKNRVEWKYSQYMDALDREDLLNRSEMTSLSSDSIM